MPLNLIKKIFKIGQKTTGVVNKALPIYVLEENSNEMLRLKTDISKQFIVYARDFLKTGDINFTGSLSESIEMKVNGEEVSVESSSPYAFPVEFGLPPGHVVNIDALRRWVEGKLGVPPDESYEVTLKIMNKIKKEGIKPTRFWKKSIIRLVKGHGVRSKLRKKVSKYVKLLKKVIKVAKKIRQIIGKTKKYISGRSKVT